MSPTRRSPENVEKFIRGLKGLNQRLADPEQEELGARITVVEAVLRGTPVSEEQMKQFEGWFACNFGDRPKERLSNVVLFQRVIDENDLPQKMLGWVLKQIKERAQKDLRLNYYRDPLEVYANLLSSPDFCWNATFREKANVIWTAIHAIYIPKGAHESEVRGFYHNPASYEKNRKILEEFVDQNQGDSSVPLEFVTHALNAMDKRMQEVCGVPRLVSQAVYRPQAVDMDALRAFFDDYDANLNFLHTRLRKMPDLFQRAQKALEECGEAHHLQKSALFPPNEEFIEALRAAADKHSGRPIDERERLTIILQALTDPEKVKAADIETINMHCDRTIRSFFPHDAQHMRTNRMLIGQVIAEAGGDMSQSSMLRAYQALGQCAYHNNVKFSIPAEIIAQHMASIRGVVPEARIQVNSVVSQGKGPTVKPREDMGFPRLDSTHSARHESAKSHAAAVVADSATTYPIGK